MTGGTKKLQIALQFYIVSGGGLPGGDLLDSTEILKKDGGTSWQTVASLPFTRENFVGVSLPNGHFMVSGEDDWLLYYRLWHFIMQHYRWI